MSFECRVALLGAPFTGLAAKRCKPAVNGGYRGATATAGQPRLRGFSRFGFSHREAACGDWCGSKERLKPSCEKPRERGSGLGESAVPTRRQRRAEYR